MMDNLLDRAADAARRAHVIDPGYPTERPAARLAIWRARQTRDLAAVLGVDVARVSIARDPRRSHLRPGAQLLTVDLTDTLDELIEVIDDDPYGSFSTGDPFGPPKRPLLYGVLRFIPIPGFEALFGVLGTCPHCRAPGVAIAAIAQLADLGNWAVIGEAPDNGLRFTLSADPLHPSCPEEHATEPSGDPVRLADPSPAHRGSSEADDD
jgi:hypothetical protein